MIDMESIYFTNMIYVRDKKTDIITSKEHCSIQKITSMYSNTKEPIFKLVINSTPISRNNTFTVKYKCQTCEKEQEITLNLYMRKVNKNIKGCDACKNKDETKCNNQREFMKQYGTDVLAGSYTKEEPIKLKKLTLEMHLEKSLSDWKDEEDHFKEQYFVYHLTIDDFERFRHKIISINNDKFMNIEDWNYFPTYRVYNQSRYTPMLIHKTDNCSEKPIYIKFKCDNCDSHHTHRDIEVIKNHYKVLCKNCSFTNKAFCLRKHTLTNGSSIMWQSIPERRFIEWCEKNKVEIKNGPKIEYIFNNKPHQYRVDFELPDHKFLIEIKDNHCWHKDQVTSGKFGEKESAATKWCTKNNYTYHVVFPKNLQKMKDSILDKSL